MPNTTAEQQARDMLERIGVPDAQSYAASDLVELANLISERARAALAAEPQGQPVPVAERLPSLGDCDERGYCWLYDDGAWTWEWATAHSLDPDGHSHWLPYYALPLPEAQP